MVTLEIEGINIRKYENNKLKMKITKDELKNVNYVYNHTSDFLTGIINYREIIFNLLDKSKIKIFVTKKKDFPKIKNFYMFLVYYCKKYKITFEKNILSDFEQPDKL